MNEQVNSDFHLRPRFKIEVAENASELLMKFERARNYLNPGYSYKMVGNHIVIDVKKEKSKYWSPQLTIEIEQRKPNDSVLNGLFGPKPQVWTFFMFIHFAIAVSFIGFLIAAYVEYKLKQPYKWELFGCVILPVLWVVMYFLGRYAKFKSRKQMGEMHSFLIETLED